MALPREREVNRTADFLPSKNPCLPLANDTTDLFPGEKFLQTYTLWADNPVNILYPNGSVRRIHPTVLGMEHRYDVLVSTFDEEALSSDVRGVYAEIIGGFIFRQMVQEATGGEYTILPTLPQLDINGRKRIPTFTDVRDKTADIMLGKVVGDVFEPCMMFDIKSSPRGDKRGSNLGVAVNSGLGFYVPVAIIYLGGLSFTDAKGSTHSLASYLKNIVHPAILQNKLPWHTLWPEGSGNNPQHEIFSAFNREVIDACSLTKQQLYEYDWDSKTRDGLLQKLSEAEKVFASVKNKVLKAPGSAA